MKLKFIGFASARLRLPLREGLGFAGPGHAAYNNKKINKKKKINKISSYLSL
jgi:hypothetical protein